MYTLYYKIALRSLSPLPDDLRGNAQAQTIRSAVNQTLQRVHRSL